jgi:hypothetical protein
MSHEKNPSREAGDSGNQRGLLSWYRRSWYNSLCRPLRGLVIVLELDQGFRCAPPKVYAVACSAGWIAFISKNSLD